MVSLPIPHTDYAVYSPNRENQSCGTLQHIHRRRHQLEFLTGSRAFSHHFHAVLRHVVPSRDFLSSRRPLYSPRIEQSGRSQGAAHKPPSIRGTQPTTAPDFQRVADCGGPGCPRMVRLDRNRLIVLLCSCKEKQEEPESSCRLDHDFFRLKSKAATEIWCNIVVSITATLACATQ